ncbi:MAG: hypothetical protein ACLGG9_01360 [Thermoleophilia bacterium]
MADDQTPTRRHETQGPARGYSWPPFEPGNTAAVKHGAFSRYVGQEAEALADDLMQAAAHLVDLDTLAVSDLALATVKVRRLAIWLEANGDLDDDGKPRAALAELRRWMKTAEGARARLGLDPTSRAALAVDETLARRQAMALARDQEAEGRRLREAAEAGGLIEGGDDGE